MQTAKPTVIMEDDKTLADAIWKSRMQSVQCVHPCILASLLKVFEIIIYYIRTDREVSKEARLQGCKAADKVEFASFLTSRVGRERVR